MCKTTTTATTTTSSTMSKGTGAAAVKEAATATGSKGDAYGKVKVFKETKLQQLLHVDEVLAGLTLALFHRPPPLSSSQYVKDHFDIQLVEFIDAMVMANDVVHVSSLLLRMLPGPVLVDAQVLSQTLRALDCVEDEPLYYDQPGKGGLEQRIQDMLTFHETALVDPHWNFPGIGESPPERQLMQEFPKIHALYKALRPESQKVVRDVTQIMAAGMVDFLRLDLSQGPKTLKQYEQYCYAISGSVGEGLSRMWAASGLEDASLATNTKLAHRLGNFAIKPTMIFTFMEDYVDKRVKWPQEIWKQYVPKDAPGIQYFFNQQDPTVRTKSLQCLNAIVTDALEMVPDSLLYLKQLKCQENFRWVATIVVATTAQLDMCYANPKIFEGCVFIRPGIICKLILKTNTIEQVQDTLHTYAQKILRRAEGLDDAVKANDPGYDKTIQVCQEIIKVTKEGAAVEQKNRQIRAMITLVLSGMAGAAYYSGMMGGGGSGSAVTTLASTVLALAASMVYISGQSFVATRQPLQKCGRA